MQKITTTLSEPSDKSYLFSVSTTAKGKEIKEIESAVDNLIMVHKDKNSHQLFLTIKRMKGVTYVRKESKLPSQMKN